MTDPCFDWNAEALDDWRRAIDALQGTRYPQLIMADGSSRRITVIVRRVTLDPGTLGECKLIKRPSLHFYIAISKRLTPSHALDTLAHEWAHALTWTYPHIDDHHGIFIQAEGDCKEVAWEVR